MRRTSLVNNPHDVAISGICAAQLQVYLREHEQAEALAVRALELSEKHQFPPEAALSRCVLGRARAELGRATEGIALIRQGWLARNRGAPRHPNSHRVWLLKIPKVR